MVDKKIYLSFPASPNSYNVKNPKTSFIAWSQICYFVYNALKNKFQNVEYRRGTIPLTENDILITHIPNEQIQQYPHKTILVDNNTFDTNVWKTGHFKKYGLNIPIGPGYPFTKYDYLYKNLYAVIFKTNDVAINKWNTNNSDVIEKKQFLLNTIQKVIILPHPIDKKSYNDFYEPDLHLPSLKMLVYDGQEGKTAKELIKVLQKNFSPNTYSVIKGIQKTEQNVKQVLNTFAYLAHVSYSEGFPYFANEFLTQGLPLFGHEEWWDPYGYDYLKWSYNPEKQDQNINNLHKLLNNNFTNEYYQMRKGLIQAHLDRKDNDWSYLTDKLIQLIEELI